VVPGCRFEQHWLLIDDILADVRSDYTDADIKSSTVDGKIYQVKMVDDLGVLYYRKSNLDKAGVQPPTTIDELIAASVPLNTKDQRGLFIGNDAGVTPSFGGGSLLGQSCGQWAATIRPPTASRVSPHLTSSSRSRARAVLVEVDIARCPYRLVGSLLVHPGSRGRAMVRAVGNTGHPEGHR
jgi:hypothetical protein